MSLKTTSELAWRRTLRCGLRIILRTGTPYEWLRVALLWLPLAAWGAGS